MTIATRLLPLGLVGALLFASCGGGDNAREVLGGSDATAPPAETEPAATEAPPETDAPTTEPPATEPPATEPAPTEPPATDVPATTAGSRGDQAAYCGASRQFYVEAYALREIGENDNEAARRLFARMEISLAATLLNAPDAEAATSPRAVEELFGVLLPALDTLGYDLADIDTLANADEVATAFTEFVDIVDLLEEFVVESCGADLAELQAAGADLAAEVGSDPTDQPGTTAPDVPAVGDDAVQSITDDSGTITASVPSTWTEVRGAPDGDLRQLAAGPDVDAFLGGYSEPGVVIAVGDAPAGNGGDAAQTALDSFETTVEADGCSQTTSVPYDDGLYVGQELLYSCPGTDASTHLAAGTNADGSIFWLLAAVVVEGDDTSWALITESFIVD